jgi:dipeptidyl aminopeptidase/acylaminoacyl peptidase
LGVLVTHPDLVKAAVLLAPVSASAKENFDRYTAMRPDLAQQVTALYGTPDTQPEFWRNVSPENFLERIRAPILLHHGTVDQSTPLAWSDQLAEQLRRAGKPVTYHVYPGEPHEFTAAWPTVMQRTRDFFRDNL